MAADRDRSFRTARTDAERGLVDAGRHRSIFAAWGSDEQRTVRPEFLRALLLGEVDGAIVSDRGLAGRNLIFAEPLDLDRMGRAGAPLPPLWLPFCELRRGGSLTASHWQSLFFTGMTVGSADQPADLDCNWIEIVHQFSGELMEVHGELCLSAERIGADVGLDGATITHLNMRSARVDGMLSCSTRAGRRFTANKVSLNAAVFGGAIVLSGAAISARDGSAVDAPEVRAQALSATVHGDDRFEASGTVDLTAAVFNGGVSFDGAALTGSDLALSADRLEATDFSAQVLDGRRLTAEGAFRLVGARIAHDVNVSGALLRPRGGLALAASGLKAHSVFARRANGSNVPFEAHGDVDLGVAQVEGHCDLGGARLAKTAGEVELRLFHARFGSLYLGSVSKGAMTFEGRIVMNNAKVDSALIVRLSEASRGVFDLSNADTIFCFDPEAWGPRPSRGGDVSTGVLLELEGFSYDSIDVEGAKSEAAAALQGASWQVRAARLRDRLLGRAAAGSVEYQLLDWLERQWPDDPPRRASFRPESFHQAASYLARVGNVRAAKVIATARQRHQQVCRVDDRFAAFWHAAYGVFFDFGYSPLRATFWAVLIFAAGWLGAHLMQIDGILVDRGREDRVEAAALVGGELKALVGERVTPRAPALVRRAEPLVRGAPCDVSSFAFAADAFIPFADLGAAGECKFATADPQLHRAARRWQMGWIIYSLICLVFVPLLTLTYSGVLRKE